MVKIKALKFEFAAYGSFPWKLNWHSYGLHFGINCTALDQSKLTHFVECTIIYVIINRYQLYSYKLYCLKKARKWIQRIQCISKSRLVANDWGNKRSTVTRKWLPRVYQVTKMALSESLEELWIWISRVRPAQQKTTLRE